LILSVATSEIAPFLGGILTAIAGIMVVASGQSISTIISMERGIQDIKNELIKLNKGIE
jgi:hypothetical protein